MITLLSRLGKSNLIEFAWTEAAWEASAAARRASSAGKMSDLDKAAHLKNVFAGKETGSALTPKLDSTGRHQDGKYEGTFPNGDKYTTSFTHRQTADVSGNLRNPSGTRHTIMVDSKWDNGTSSERYESLYNKANKGEGDDVAARVSASKASVGKKIAKGHGLENVHWDYQ